MKFDLKSYIIKKLNNLGVKNIFFNSFDTFKDKKTFLVIEDLYYLKKMIMEDAFQ